MPSDREEINESIIIARRAPIASDDLSTELPGKCLVPFFTFPSSISRSQAICPVRLEARDSISEYEFLRDTVSTGIPRTRVNFGAELRFNPRARVLRDGDLYYGQRNPFSVTPYFH